MSPHPRAQFVSADTLTKTMIDMSVNMIVAAGSDGAIGKDGNLIWHISSDLKRFKALTMGHPVIMGRKTWESLPKRPLPGRRNIVVSRNPEFTAPGAETAASPRLALEMTRGEEPFVMGGAQIYNELLPFIDRIFLTEINAECSDADARLPFPPSPDVWVVESCEEPLATPEGVNYRYVTYVKKK